MKILLLLLLAFALTPTVVFGKTVPIPAEGITITIPDDWTLLKRPNAVLVAAAPGESTALGVVISSNLHQTQIDSAYLDGMKEGYAEKAKKEGIGIKITDYGIRNLNGVPSGFMETEQSFSENRTIYSQAYNVAANSKFILLTLDTRDPYMVSTLQKIAESLHFDKTPELPDPAVFVVHRLGEVGGVILLIGFAAFGARLLYRRYVTE